jgi:hypothetical protein
VFPDKLRWRIGEMEKLLCTEFPAAEKRVNNREPLLPFYEGTENGARRYSIRSCDVNRAEWMSFTDRQGNPRPTTSVRVALEGDEYCFQFRLCGKGDTLKIDPEFHMFHRLAPIVLKDGEISLSLNYGYSLFGEKIDEYKSRFKLSHFCEGDIEFYELRFRYADFEMEVIEPFRMMITRSGQYDDVAAPDDRMFSRLIVGTFSPDAFCFFVPAYRYEAAKPEDYAIPKTNGKVVWRR